jgi:hypothetical protein
LIDRRRLDEAQSGQASCGLPSLEPTMFDAQGALSDNRRAGASANSNRQQSGP